MRPAGRSLRVALACALCLVPLASSAQTPPAGRRPAPPRPSDPRADVRPEIDAFAAALDRAVRRVSRPAWVIGASSVSPRGYHLPGVGAVFVLPPRALPARRTRTGDPRAARALAEAVNSLQESLQRVDSPELRRRIRLSLETLKQTQSDLRRTGHQSVHVLIGPDDVPQPEPLPLPELERDFERHVQAMHHQADAFRREAARAAQEAERELRERLGEPLLPEPPSAPEVPEASLPPAPAAPAKAPVAPAAPAPPPPPWQFWFEADEPAEVGDPEVTVREVRSAVYGVLEAQGPRLRRLRPEESVVVALDFVDARAGASRAALAGASRPQRTLVLRVRKKDIDERVAGRLAAEEFRQRVEVAEY